MKFLLYTLRLLKTSPTWLQWDLFIPQVKKKSEVPWWYKQIKTAVEIKNKMLLKV